MASAAQAAGYGGDAPATDTAGVELTAPEEVNEDEVYDEHASET